MRYSAYQVVTSHVPQFGQTNPLGTSIMQEDLEIIGTGVRLGFTEAWDCSCRVSMGCASFRPHPLLRHGLFTSLSKPFHGSLQLSGHSPDWGLLQLSAYFKGNTLLHAETKVPKTKSTSKGTLLSPWIISTVNVVTQRMQKCKILIFGTKRNYYIFMGNWQMAISHLELGYIYIFIPVVK